MYQRSCFLCCHFFYTLDHAGASRKVDHALLAEQSCPCFEGLLFKLKFGLFVFHINSSFSLIMGNRSCIIQLDSGYFFLMCAMRCSHSRWARRVTEQPRTTMTSASEWLSVSSHPAARYSASLSSASARFNLHPNVSKQTFIAINYTIIPPLETP